MNDIGESFKKGYQYVVGVEDSTYTKDGNQVVATRLYVASPIQCGVGFSTVEHFIKAPAANFKTGPILTALFTTRGKFTVCNGVVYADGSIAK